MSNGLHAACFLASCLPCSVVRGAWCVSEFFGQPQACQLFIKLQGKALQMAQWLRQFKIERANELIDLIEALRKNPPGLVPLVVRKATIDAAAAPGLHDPLVSARDRLPCHFDLGANFVLFVQPARRYALLLRQMLKRIRIEMREGFALAAQLIELARFLRFLNVLFDIEACALFPIKRASRDLGGGQARPASRRPEYHPFFLPDD